MKARASTVILPIIITVLALTDGVIHLLLNFVLFGGGRGGPPGPPPGAPPRGGPPPGAGGIPFILPLNQLFVLNFVGAVILVLLFWVGLRWLGRRSWLVDVVMIGYAATTFVAWLLFGRPNPMDLGYLSKSIEFVLVIALLVHIWTILRQPGTGRVPGR
jgi:hypothetical protein